MLSIGSVMTAIRMDLLRTQWLHMQWLRIESLRTERLGMEWLRVESLRMERGCAYVCASLFHHAYEVYAYRSSPPRPSGARLCEWNPVSDEKERARANFAEKIIVFCF